MKTDCNLETNDYLSKCDRRDVISFNSRDPIYLSKLSSLIQASLDQNILNSLSNLIIQKLERKCDAKLWFEDGEKCEILKANSSGWQKGNFRLKMNISLEFIPDEPEKDTSPLDDVRQEININNTQQ